MGKRKTKTETKPIYSKEIEGAANSVTNSYNNNRGTVDDIAGGYKGLFDDLLVDYDNGDRGIDAARDYNVDVLTRDSANPYLDDIISQTNNNVMNQRQAIMGTRGQSGTSDFSRLIARDLAENESNLRYADYDAEEARKAAAAGRAPGLSAAELFNISPLLAVGEQAAMLPTRNAAGYASTIGGLLGPYTNSTQTQSGGLLGGLLGAGLTGWASGGFKI